MKKCVFYTVVLVFLCFNCAFAANFSDVNTNFWAKDNIDQLVKIGVVNGYPDGTFKPNNSITRAEFAKIMATSLGLTYLQDTQKTFKDVSSNNWEYPYVEGIKDYLTGYKDAYGNMYFRSNDMAVREDMAVALVKALGYTQTTDNTSKLYNIFTDASQISDELKSFVLIAYEKGLIKGYEDGTFRPQGELTRAEVVTLISRVLDSNGGNSNNLPQFVYNAQTKSIDLGVNYNLYEYSYSSNTNPRNWYQPTKRVLDLSNITANYVFVRYKSTYDDYAIINVTNKTTMYTITYDANGGSGVPSSQTKIQGEPLVLSNIKPTKNGYRFLGWSLYATSTTATYMPGTKYTNDATVTLYAIWEKAVTYRVTYNATWGTGAPDLQNKVSGEDLILSSTIPVREGYIFKGWSTNISSTVVSYKQGDKYTSDANITLYAVWEQDNTTPVVPGQTTYTITYNANGGSGVPSNQTKIHDEDLVLRTTTPTRNGYTFIGWNTDRNSLYATYISGATYKKNESVTLYAIWQQGQDEKYTITYNANGGSGQPNSQTKTAGQTIYISNTKPTREGYTFLGWSTSNNATSVMYSSGAMYSNDRNITLYAVWQLNGGTTPPNPGQTTYTITYNANGGSGAPGTQTKISGQALILSTITPNKSGYVFLGWSSNSNTTIPEYQIGGIFAKDANTTLYAVWQEQTQIQICKVTYNANGGSGAPSAQTKQHGQNINLSTTIPTRSGYTFLGWSTNSSDISPTFTPGSVFMVTSDVTLYAIWQQEQVQTQTYTITYNANGGSGAPSIQTKTTGQTIWISNTKPTRSGYTFLGWSTSNSATSAMYSSGSMYANDQNITLYAVWQLNGGTTPPNPGQTTYTITYNANGGSGAPSAQTKQQGQTIYISSIKPTRSGYTFMGWDIAIRGTTVYYRPGDSFGANASANLYAVWQKTTQTYTITYDANGGSGAPSTQTKTTGQTIYISSTKPTKSGYVFDGWKQISPYTGQIYLAGTVFREEQSITLQAIWKPAPTYTITYNTNGGYGGPTTQTKKHDDAIIIPNGVPVRAGYTFDGWKQISPYTGQIFMPGFSFSSNQSVTLEAMWKTAGSSGGGYH